MTTSERTTRDLLARAGAITPTALRALAFALERLTRFHVLHRGAAIDRPQLRRMEHDGEFVIAHVTSGGDIGGIKLRLAFVDERWCVVDEDDPRSR